MITAISATGIKNNFKNQTQTTNNTIEQSNTLNKDELKNLPSGYHNKMFKTNQKLSKICFTGLPQEAKMLQLKKALTQVCEETITNYTNCDKRTSQNSFTRSFVHHCFDFEEKVGDNLHNTHDPFSPSEWSSFNCFRRKTTVSGLSLEDYYKDKMKAKIDNWNEKFINLISNEKADNKNNLIDELLEMNGDVGSVKSKLGIDF